MLWYKSWLETRWRFVIGLVLLVCSAGGTVLVYPKVAKLMPITPALDLSGELGRRIRESVELAREYRGYVWSQWFRQNLIQMVTIFAVLLGTGGLPAQGSGGAALFTLSLPVSRNRLLGIRASAGLAELLALVGEVFGDLSRYSIFRVMNGEVYFRTGELPWPGLLASAIASAAMLYGAVIAFARRDF